jgi:group I intron endonuclease
MYEIYLIKNKVNGKCYVGYTTIGYEKRFSKHVTESLGLSMRYLCKAIRKYGKENFSVELLDTAEEYANAIEKERYYIREYNSFAHVKGSNGYNATRGGDGVDGYNVPKTLRLKMRALKKEQKAWVGKDNPNYGKGALMSGEKHFLYGKRHSRETKEKIAVANKGRHRGIKNPASIKFTTYAKCVTDGQIIKADSFYEMRKKFNNLGFKFNRSSVLRSIRSGQHSMYGYVFYRKDITDPIVFSQIELEYDQNILNPPEIPDYGKGNHHPNAKNKTSFAIEVKTGLILRFSSWYECKRYISDNFTNLINYSEMYKVAIGKRKSARGFKFYREDLNPDEILELEKGEYQEPSTTSRKA